MPTNLSAGSIDAAEGREGGSYSPLALIMQNRQRHNDICIGDNLNVKRSCKFIKIWKVSVVLQKKSRQAFCEVYICLEGNFCFQTALHNCVQLGKSFPDFPEGSVWWDPSKVITNNETI